jgi:hypothetical protein
MMAKFKMNPKTDVTSPLISDQLTFPLDSQKSKIWKIIFKLWNGPAILIMFTWDRKVENVPENKTDDVHASVFPFIDERGFKDPKVDQWKLITYPYDTRCPIILTVESNFTKFLVLSAHQDWVHPQTSSGKSKAWEKVLYFSLENLLFLHLFTLS